jgi:hypothetical protein
MCRCWTSCTQRPLSRPNTWAASGVCVFVRVFVCMVCVCVFVSMCMHEISNFSGDLLSLLMCPHTCLACCLAVLTYYLLKPVCCRRAASHSHSAELLQVCSHAQCAHTCTVLTHAQCSHMRRCARMHSAHTCTVRSHMRIQAAAQDATCNPHSIYTQTRTCTHSRAAPH